MNNKKTFLFLKPQRLFQYYFEVGYERKKLVKTSNLLILLLGQIKHPTYICFAGNFQVDEIANFKGKLDFLKLSPLFTTKIIFRFSLLSHHNFVSLI